MDTTDTQRETPTNDQIPEATTGAVVVGIDGSDNSETALVWAAEQASLEHRPLVVLFAADSAAAFSQVWAEGSPIDHSQVIHDVETEARRMSEEAAERARALHPGGEVRTLVTLSDARHALLEAADHASLVVLGSRGRGPVASLLIGSVGHAVSRHAACPVVVLRPGAEEHAGGIVVGVDGRASSRPVLDFAFREASLRGRPLTVLHTHVDQISMAYGLHIVADTAEVQEATRTLAEAVAGFQEKFPDVEINRVVRGQEVEPALLEGDPDASLIVVGRRHGHLASLHASIATSVLEHASTAVAVVPAS